MLASFLAKSYLFPYLTLVYGRLEYLCIFVMMMHFTPVKRDSRERADRFFPDEEAKKPKFLLLLALTSWYDFKVLHAGFTYEFFSIATWVFLYVIFKLATSLKVPRESPLYPVFFPDLIIFLMSSTVMVIIYSETYSDVLSNAIYRCVICKHLLVLLRWERCKFVGWRL